jgi:hypothetical protein
VKVPSRSSTRDSTGLMLMHCRQTRSNVQEETLPLDSTVPLKGCELSPYGDYLAYWTDSKVYIFTNDQVDPDGRSVLVAEWPPGIEPSPMPPTPEEAAAAITWQSLCLTTRYLVASTTNAQVSLPSAAP